MQSLNMGKVECSNCGKSRIFCPCSDTPLNSTNPLEIVLNNCGDCPWNPCHTQGDAYEEDACGYPDITAIISVQYDTIPKECPLRERPVLLKTKTKP